MKTQSQKKIKLGFVGAGRIARRHANALSSITSVEIAAWSAGHHHNAEAAAAEFGGTATQPDALIADPQIDAVLICSPTHLHSEQTHKALAAGKKVFCEKPFTRTLQESEALVDIDDGRIYVGHVLRFFHAYNRARQIIQRGDLGMIQRVVCKRLGRSDAERGKWMQEVEKSGGVLLDLAIHDFDWLLWTFGEPENIKVETDMEKDPEGYLHATTHLQWQSGLRAEVVSSWLNESSETTLHIEGDAGSLTLSPANPNELVLKSEPYVREIPLAGLPDPYQMQMKHFVGWLNGLIEPIVTS